MPTTPIDPPVADGPRPGRLNPGPQWTSFEQFRVAGSAAVEAVGAGQVGTLRTKAGVFRVLRDEDFQALLGLVGEAERLRNSLTTMVHAVNVVREHPKSSSARDLLLHLATQYIGAAKPPNRQGPAPETGSVPSALVPDDEEIIIDPAELRKRVARR